MAELSELLVSHGAGAMPGVVVDMHEACTRLSLDVLGMSLARYDFNALQQEASEDVMVRGG